MKEINKLKYLGKGERASHRISVKIKIAISAIGSMMAAFLCSTPVLASNIDVGPVTAPLDAIKTLLLAAVGVLGVIILILGLVDFISSLNSHDTGGQKNGVMKMISGVLLVGVPLILTLMGY